MEQSNRVLKRLVHGGGEPIQWDIGQMLRTHGPEAVQNLLANLGMCSRTDLDEHTLPDLSFDVHLLETELESSQVLHPSKASPLSPCTLSKIVKKDKKTKAEIVPSKAELDPRNEGIFWSSPGAYARMQARVHQFKAGGRPQKSPVVMAAR